MTIVSRQRLATWSLRMRRGRRPARAGAAATDQHPQATSPPRRRMAAARGRGRRRGRRDHDRARSGHGRRVCAGRRRDAPARHQPSRLTPSVTRRVGLPACVVTHDRHVGESRRATSIARTPKLFDLAECASRHVRADVARRSARSATASPVSCGRAAARPAQTSSSALMGPRASGPLPIDHRTSVATSRHPAIFRAEASGGGQRMDSIRLAARAAAAGGMSWRRPSGILMSCPCTRMSTRTSRWVTPTVWRCEPIMPRSSDTIC